MLESPTRTARGRVQGPMPAQLGRRRPVPHRSLLALSTPLLATGAASRLSRSRDLTHPCEPAGYNIRHHLHPTQSGHFGQTPGDTHAQDPRNPGPGGRRRPPHGGPEVCPVRPPLPPLGPPRQPPPPAAPPLLQP